MEKLTAKQIVERIPGLVQEKELQFLAISCTTIPLYTDVVELGCFMGRTTAYLCQFFPMHRVTAIDSFVMQHHGENSQQNTIQRLAAMGHHPIVLKAESSVVPDFIHKVGFLMIDTDHVEKQLEKELDAWLPKVVVDGVVYLHDYSNPKWPEIFTYVNKRLLHNPNFMCIGHFRYLVGFRRIKEDG